MSSIISGAFGLVRERPLAVLVWGVIYMAVSVLLGFVTQSQMQSMAVAGDPAVASSAAFSMLGNMILVQLGYLLVLTILMTASLRAVLRPWDKRVFHLRFGMDELRMIGLALLYAIIFYGGMIVALMIVGVFAALVAGASPFATMVTMFVGGIVVMVVAIWLSVRLSLSYPLTLLREKIVIGESWTLTGGHFWTLFGGYLVIFLVVFVVAGIIGLATNSSYFAEVARGGFSIASMDAAAQRQLADQSGQISAFTVLGWALGSVSGSLFIALSGGAIATATRELATDQEALAREFE